MSDLGKSEWKRRRGIYPLKGKIKVRKIFGLDIETYGRDNKLVLGCIYGEYKGKEIYFRFTSTKEFIKIIHDNHRVFRSAYIFATSLEFDFKGLFSSVNGEYMDRFNFIYQNGNITYASTYMSYEAKDYTLYSVRPESGGKHKYYSIYFLDTLHFIKAGVKELGRMVGVPKGDYELKKDKDGICVYPDDIEALAEYNKTDAKITSLWMVKFQETINKIGGCLKLTAASTSMDMFKRNYLKRPIYQPSRAVILYLYKFYFGGRTECIKRGLIDEKNFGVIRYYDVNSMYPYAMLDYFPIPTGNERILKGIKMDTIMKHEGVCRCRVKVPIDDYFPLIPVRKDKLIFPVGVFDCNVDFMTLRKAIKTGVQVLKIYDGVVYENIGSPFKTYMESMFEKRKEYKKNNNPMETVFKLLMNSFYGKMGFRFDNKKSYITMDAYLKKFNASSREEQDRLFMETERNGFHEYTKNIIELPSDENSRIPNYVNPIFAIYVTARSRNLLYDHIKDIEEDVVYMDTDSIFTRANKPTSSELGQLKLENEFKKLVIVAPKVYRYEDIHGNSTIRVKGVPKASDKIFEEIIKGDRVKYLKFTKWKESIRRNIKGNTIINSDKIISHTDTKRIWDSEFTDKKIINSRPIILTEEDVDGEDKKENRK